MIRSLQKQDLLLLEYQARTITQLSQALQLGEMIVTGGYRTLSKELYHGALVSFNDN